MPSVYTAVATATGDGRNGHTRSSDGLIDLDLATPKEMGGEGGATNPEQLFAAGYAACFLSALKLVARTQKAPISDAGVTAEVGIGPDGAGGFGLEIALHARTEARADDARAALPAAEGVLVGDLSTIAGTRAVAEQAGSYDAVVHNAAVGYREPRRLETEDGLAHVFAVNVLAPYLLTALLPAPSRLVYLSSGMHRGGDPSLDDVQWTRRRWNGSQAYADSKLWDLVLAFAVARRWPSVRSNAVDPGWVPTRMGGPGAPDDLSLAPVTQAWLAVSDDPAAAVSGGYFSHQRPRASHPAASDVDVQEGLLAACAHLTGVALP